MTALAQRLVSFATRRPAVCNSAPAVPAVRLVDPAAPAKALSVVNPDTLTREEADKLREAGYDVPAPQPKPSIWK